MTRRGGGVLKNYVIDCANFSTYMRVWNQFGIRGGGGRPVCA